MDKKLKPFNRYLIILMGIFVLNSCGEIKHEETQIQLESFNSMVIIQQETKLKGENIVKIKAVSDGDISAEIPIELTVWNFSLHDEASHSSHFGHFGRIAEYWNIKSAQIGGVSPKIRKS